MAEVDECPQPSLAQRLSELPRTLLRSRGSAHSDIESSAGAYKRLTSGKATPRSPGVFRWNGRLCEGHELHKAALSNNSHEVLRLLEDNPEALHVRFTYETFFKGHKQEGSGEAIHLAASRGHLEMVELLLSRGARLDAWVTRDQRPHYDVLHAAVFAEGHGGRLEMVKSLLEKKAPIEKNLDGKTPLHLAFQTGACKLIPLLQQQMEQKRWQWESELPSPLEMGITFGRMSQAQLSAAAPTTPASLRAFIHHDPDCIPRFLKHVRESAQEGVSCHRLAAHLEEGDVAKLFCEAPGSAVALINACTAEPECESVGWHPLPSRVSFAPKNFTDRIREVLNKGDYLYSFYEHDRSWRYDQVEFTYPEWHQLLDWNRGRPRRDVDVRVCHVPNIINPAFFSSLMQASDVDETLSFFDSNVIRGSISFTFWTGACKVDLMQFFFSIWSLAVLIAESWLLVDMQEGFEGKRLPEISVSRDFIGAKGLLDLVHELVQIAGCAETGRLKDYANFGNLWDMMRCCLLIMLKYMSGNRLVHVCVVFIYWCRLLEAITFAEKIASALLPITSLVRGLMPAFIVTLVGFLAFTHGFYVAQDVRREPREAVFNSFRNLITAGMPREPPVDMLELVLTYISTIFFTIFFLNIFIGVIGEQYSLEKQRCRRTFQKMRAASCLTFLLRVKVLPCNLLHRWTAEAVLVLAVLASMALQVLGLMRGASIPYACLIFFFLQVLMFLASYQNPKAPWAARNARAPYYLWLATPHESDL
mmetsp:Transcript_29735/g.85132  ORF Transcript_29735/g.85132 Transcript_29735/m.85132 type:complete len:759 (+) Transcript_29735:69-2345(+)